MKIAISKGVGSERYENYAKWVRAFDPSVECVELSAMPHGDALATLEECDGLILTGGWDVKPEHYDMHVRHDECFIEDDDRDEREFAYLEYAEGTGMPVLGICRGMQLMNVYYGGTLFIDIPTDVPGAIIHRKKEGDAWHPITLVASSPLGEESSTMQTNSSHHQSVDRVADDFVPIAKTSDGVIEAMIPTEESGLRSMLAVQWHPERMESHEPMSAKVIEYFFAQCDLRNK